MSQRKSAAWNHFTKVCATKVRCKYCAMELKYCGNTTNLWTHVSGRHNIKRLNDCVDLTTEIDENSNMPVIEAKSSKESDIPSKQSKLCTIEDSFQKITAYKGGGIRAAELNSALMFMIAHDHLPLLTPDRTGFKYFIKRALPLYKPPCRKTVTKMMRDKYDVLTVKIRNIIKELESYCLTADIWTNIQTTTSYLGLTLHYYKNGKNMQSVTIGVQALNESHTAAYISTIIFEICCQWGIEIDKISVIVTDNGENMVKAAKDTFGKAKHLPCFAHTINLLAYDVLGTHKVNGTIVDNVEGISTLLNKVRKIITFFKKSVNASDSLRKLQYQRGKSEGTALRLIQDVSTRWNSTYLSLIRFRELSDEIGITLLKHSASPNMLTGAELDIVRVICELLAPLYQVTEELSAEKVPTASKVIPLLNLLQKRISSVEVSDEISMLKRMKDRLLLQFGTRFGQVEKVRPLALATLLDPRFKKLHFNKPLAVAEAINVLCNEINGVRRNVRNTSSSTQLHKGDQHTSKYEDDLWTIHDSLATKSAVVQEEEVDGISIELRQFLNLPVTNRTNNPYETWISLQSQFPNLYQLAMKHLSIVATSVPAERLFSEAGLIATDMRNRLTGSNLSMLIFLSSIDETIWV
ncbi:PREDICTED: zinc finger BED domain-containing protein 1-like [Vollenhovia emeryi]|uniref:zinc finger BED domain-containing protein 1-like n=1 Tax=Vollenhovia emeryi TaxID=411798 RepID=UPI0005F49767|nr:PREDICTED: zinc finger BED domain-containing protein 1-like [Vollenhovia emeryi]XP_011884115.1 PREDICTED: zinc finger BED domain-containing protein 1-like [Vollenhovia emeryi]XP_011884116.1 PREDICTED: zinc finger BED domain-containing protein 1-like [Vollenhovia emeryi]